MRVLDLGCGRASSSIFLRREFGVQVWATDLWFSAAENIQRIRDAGVEDGVFPLHADARSLPFAPDFFDAIVCIDSFPYFGTDDLYLNYLAQFVKPGGPIGDRRGRAGAGDRGRASPNTCGRGGRQDLWAFHSAAWWRRHWERTGIVDVEVADTMPDGWQALAGLAPGRRPGQRHGDQGDRGGRGQVSRLRPRRRPSAGRGKTGRILLARHDAVPSAAIHEKAVAPGAGVERLLGSVT